MGAAEDRSREMQLEDEALEEYRGRPGRDAWLDAWVADSLEYLTRTCTGLPWNDAGPSRDSSVGSERITVVQSDGETHHGDMPGMRAADAAGQDMRPAGLRQGIQEPPR